MIAFLTALLGAPAAIASLLNRISALEAWVERLQKEKLNAAIDEEQHHASEAKTDEEMIKVAHEMAEITRKL